MSTSHASALEQQLASHLQRLYPDENVANLGRACLQALDLRADAAPPPPRRNLWSERDCVLVSYGDTLRRDGEAPLRTLHQFVHTHLPGRASALHVLPFFPYSSDDGFSVMDYSAVNPSLGSWGDIRALASDFTVMADLVVNHCSSRSLWFENYKAGRAPGAGYFFEAPPDFDYSAVVRPRTSKLLREVLTVHGRRHVWCTFSEDQVDLDFRNPAVLLEFLRIIALYLEQGVRWFRLDAVAFVWKQLGTPCIHLPETHELVRLLRLLIEHRQPDAVVVTETNVPSHENLSYFGNANEAHMVYNFPLPPLLLHTLLTGDCTHLRQWLNTLPATQDGTAYLNFIASHDGIGLRPVEGLLTEWEIGTLIQTLQRFDARVSSRSTADGASKPYEINVTLWDAMRGTTHAGPDAWQLARYLCAHAIMLSLQGVPALYIHSLLATGNDHRRVEQTGQPRAINRHVWQAETLERRLRADTHHRQVFQALCRMLELRRRQPSLHPNASQHPLQLGRALFGCWRQSPDQNHHLFAIHNVSDRPRALHLDTLNLPAATWLDLFSGRRLGRFDHLMLTPYQYLWLVPDSAVDQP